MEWEKVTPKTLPPDMQPVMATVIIDLQNGIKPYKRVIPNIGYNQTRRQWVYWPRLIDGIYESYEPIPWYMTVTHWKPYPDPAED